MKESRDGIKSNRHAKSSSVSSLPLILDVDDFKVKKKNIRCSNFCCIAGKLCKLRTKILRICRVSFHLMHCLETW